MIPAVCSICADFFEADHTLVSNPCGHVFHEHCLLQWIETSSTCPQCRRHTSQRKLIRLYFEVQEDTEQLDPTKLKNQLAELEAEISRRQKEKNDLAEEHANFNDRITTLTKNMKKVTKKLSEEQSTNEALKKQLDVMSYRMDEAKEAKREAKRLREKLQFLERFEAVMTRNSTAVESMLKEFGDGPKSARELATYCASLKREFENIKDSRKQLKEENSQLKKDLTHKSRSLEVRTRDHEAMQQSVVSLQDDVQALEKEKRELREKVEQLQAVLSSPGGGALSASFRQTLCRTPSNLNKKPRLSQPEEGDDIILDPGNPQTPDLSMPSPSVETKNTCKELGIPFVRTTSAGIKKKKAESDGVENVWKHTLASSSLFNRKRALQSDEGSIRKGYNGMGGHNTFIELEPVMGRPATKKAFRGPKRKPSSKPCSHALPTLDRFMSSSSS